MYRSNVTPIRHVPAGHRLCLFHPKLIHFHIMDTTAGASRRKKPSHWDIRHTLGWLFLLAAASYFAVRIHG